MAQHKKNLGLLLVIMPLLSLLLLLLSPQLWAVSCSNVFSNGLQAHGTSGNINLGYHTQINGGTTGLQTRTLSDNSQHLACNNAACAPSGIAAPTSTVTFQTGSAANGAINIGYQGNQNVAAGDYGAVNVEQQGSLRFNTNSGLYLMRGVTTGYRAEIRLRTGDYWIDGDLHLSQETVLRRITASGSTRIFVRGNITIGYQVATDDFSANELLIYATGNIHISQGANLQGFLYAGGNVDIGYGVTINGAVAGANVYANAGQSIINYQGSALTSAEFLPFCGFASVDHYELQIAAESLACEGATVIVRACANSAVPCTKELSINDTVQLQTSAGALNSTALTLVAGEASTKLLYPAAVENALASVNVSSVTTAASNATKCCTGTSSCTVAASCSTLFKRAGFKFSSTASASVADVPTEIAGVTDTNVYLRSVKSDDATGACVARFTSPQAVQLAYKCINPTSCIAGQKLMLASSEIQANAAVIADASVTYTNNVSVNFDANGSANIPFNYSDVGQVRLLARLALDAVGDEPAYTFTGISNDFVVKPHTLAISAVTNAAGTNNPGTTNSGTGFVAAGEAFQVSVQARNAAGDPTPNFGNELTPETESLALTANDLVYPDPGTLTALSNSGVFSATSSAGTFINPGIQWKQVGSITLAPSLADNNYLDASDIPNKPASGTVGRFYPHHFALTSSSLANSCSTFSYMRQPLVLAYRLEAQGLGDELLTNYGPLYGTMPSISYVAENADSGIDLGARVNDEVAKVWAAGVLAVNSSAAYFNRELLSAAPDGPFESLQIGLQLTDGFDLRKLEDLNINAATSGNCSGAACTAISVGSLLNMRYGRLRLDDAFGPETADLPVNLITEYWAGNYFAKNTADSCTLINRTAIIYPSGNIVANSVVDLGGGETTGAYPYASPTAVGFLAGDARHYFTAPTGAATGNFTVDVNLTDYPWLRFDWDQNGSYTDANLPRANFGFGSYRGHDRIIYWRERFQ